MLRKLLFLVSILLIASFLLSACGTAATPTPQPTTAAAAAPTDTSAPPTATDAQKVTITWWHISTADDQKALFQKFADEYMAMHPNVNIEITVLDNEAFKTKLTTVMQSGEPPDIFQSWGGGVMNQYADAGLLQDITPELDANNSAWRNTFSPGALGVYAYEGKNYGVPWDMGMVGFFYNKDLFSQAGIDAPPTTWTDFLADITKLKAAGITPIALAEGDKWPGAFWWEYMAVRIGGQAAFDAAASRKGAFTDQPFVDAGTTLKQLIDMQPFQAGYLNATQNDAAALMGNGQAAMQLMGQWDPGVEAANSESKKGIGDSLGWFPFPMVEGGAGAPTDALGGGNGFAIGKNAPPGAVDFVKYLSRPESQVQMAQIGMNVPVVKGGEAGLTDPNLLAVQKGAAAAQYFQLYYDQYLPPAMGSVINDNVQGLFAGTMTPEQVAQALEDSAKQELK